MRERRSWQAAGPYGTQQDARIEADLLAFAIIRLGESVSWGVDVEYDPQHGWFAVIIETRRQTDDVERPPLADVTAERMRGNAQDKTLMWSTSDVACFLGVRIGTLSSYRGRNQMPPPSLTKHDVPYWLPHVIEAWRDTRKPWRPNRSDKTQVSGR